MALTNNQRIRALALLAQRTTPLVDQRFSEQLVDDCELAYRLYTTSERKGFAQEALAYNALVVAWPEIARLAAEAPAQEALL